VDGDLVPAEIVRRSLRLVLGAAHQHAHPRLHVEVEESVHVAPRLGVRCPHECVADHGDPCGGRRHRCVLSDGDGCGQARAGSAPYGTGSGRSQPEVTSTGAPVPMEVSTASITSCTCRPRAALCRWGVPCAMDRTMSDRPWPRPASTYPADGSTVVHGPP